MSRLYTKTEDHLSISDLSIQFFQTCIFCSSLASSKYMKFLNYRESMFCVLLFVYYPRYKCSLVKTSKFLGLILLRPWSNLTGTVMILNIATEQTLSTW